MSKLFQLLIPSVILLSGLKAECPSIDSLPVLNSAGDNFYCAFDWADDFPWEHELPLDACLGRRFDEMDNVDMDAAGGFYIIGGLIVKAGCTLYGYSEPGFDGDLIQYDGPATFPNGCTGNSCPPVKNSINWGFSSFKCRCRQEPIICQPSDHYVTIMQCDNMDNDVEVTCSYTKTIGTTWTNDVTNSMSIDVTIKNAMSASFFEFFEAELGISGTTGYDWTHTSSEAKSDTEEFKVETVVYPNSILIIEGAEGECGGNNVKTELFRFTSTDRDGNIISQTREFGNGNNTNIIIY